MTFVIRCLLYVEFRLSTNRHQISISYQCLWSDVEMTFAIKYLLDVEFRLWTVIHHDQYLNNVFGLMLKWHFRLDVYWMLNFGCDSDIHPISMSKICLQSDVEMTFVIRWLLDVEFRLWKDINPISMFLRCWI